MAQLEQPATPVDLDRLRRAELQGRPAAVAGVLDDWLHAQHGLLSSAHGVGAFLTELAEAGYRIVPGAPAP